MIKKAIIIVVIFVLASCKTTKTKCDAYGKVEVNTNQISSQAK